MSIEIPDAAIEDLAKRFAHAPQGVAWEKRKPFQQNEYRAKAKSVIEAALPHLIPAVTADLRAQVEAEIREDERERLKEALEKYAAQDGVLYVLMYPGFGEEHSHAWTPWLDDAFDEIALAGTEGDDANIH